MSTVVLIGVDAGGGLGLVGLYEDEFEAQKAVMSREVPSGLHYSVHTPAMNSFGTPVVIPPRFEAQTCGKCGEHWPCGCVTQAKIS